MCGGLYPTSFVGFRALHVLHNVGLKGSRGCLNPDPINPINPKLNPKPIPHDLS